MANLPLDARALCDLIRARIGVDYEYRWEQLAARVQARIRPAGFEDLHEYRAYLESAPASDREFRELASALTYSAGTFFRERTQLELLTRVLPLDLLARPGHSTELRVWSAACGAGEEPYSLAMLWLDLGLAAPASMNIVATDLSEQALAVARGGVYPARAFGRADAELVARYCRRQDDDYAVTSRIQACVRFECLNLIDDAAVAKLPQFDIILCRNVLMYFNREMRGAVLASLAAKLCDRGYLVLGHADSRADLASAFEVLNDDLGIYRKRAGGRT